MPDVFSTLLGAALSVGAGALGFWWQRRYEGRCRFLAVTAEIRAELDLSPYDSADIFVRSRTRLVHAIHLCRPFVSQYQFNRLNAVWREYRRLNREDLDITKSGRGLEYAEQTGCDPHETLLKYLDQFDECITCIPT